MQNISTLKHQLLSLIQNKNSKGYARLVSTRPILLEYVLSQKDLLQTHSIAETLWCIVNDQSPPLCKCGGTRIFNTFVLGYRLYCKKTCTAKRQSQSEKISTFWKENPDKLENMIRKRDQTNLEKYGYTNAAKSIEVQEKTTKTNLERYGAVSPLQSPEVQNKIKKTTVERYGVNYPFQSTDIQKKAAETFNRNHPDVIDKMELARQRFIQIHGVNPFAVPEIKEKIRESRLKKYGYVHALQNHLSSEIIDILENKNKFIYEVSSLTLAEAAEKLGVNPTTIARRAISYDCKDIFVKSSRSKWEFKIKNFLLTLGLIEGIDFITGDRQILNGKELDFYFPKISAAVEVGSVFWHSELSAGRGYNYHFNKWKDCIDKNINLYQYWDYELEHKWEVIASKITYLFKKVTVIIGARKIKDFRIVPIKEERLFLEFNHLQGYTGDRKKTFGAYQDNKLMAIMSLATRANGIEIVRYATQLSANYPGLFSKLLKYSLTQLNATNSDVFSFSDNRHSSGNVYKQTGFELIKESAPTYYYTKNYHLTENKKKFTKQKIQDKFKIDITGKTEWQLMQDLGYDRIWDAGKKLWKLTNKNFISPAR